MLSEPKTTTQQISEWLCNQLYDAERNSFILGVSGGIDSAVVFRLLQMTGKPFHCYFLPKNKKQEKELEPLVLELCGDVNFDTIYLDDFVNVECLPYIHDANKRNIALGNLYARMRMSILYYHSEYYKGLVVGTTNLAEWEVGYFTKYGDGGVDVEPIIGLLKHEVYQLARDGFDNPVPDSILEAIPSAGLWDGQTDEGEMGISYDDLDERILHGKDKISPEVFHRIEELSRKSGHKHEMPKSLFYGFKT